MAQCLITIYVAAVTMLACINFTEDFIHLTLIYWVVFALTYAYLEIKKTASNESH